MSMRHVSRGRDSRALVVRSGQRPLPQIYLSKTRGDVSAIYHGERAPYRRGAFLKWVVGTVLTAFVAVAAIAFLIVGSVDEKRDNEDMLASLQNLGRTIMEPVRTQLPSSRSGVASPKADKLVASEHGLATKHIVQDTVKLQKDGREFIVVKPFGRVIATLATVAPADAPEIPPFNPFALYTNSKPIGDEGGDGKAEEESLVSIAVEDLVGGILPEEDGQELSTAEVAELIALTTEDTVAEVATADEGAGQEPLAMGATLPELTELDDPTATGAASGLTPANEHTTDLAKTPIDEPKGVDGEEVRVVRVAAGDKLPNVLRTNGVTNWQTKAITEAARTIVETDVLQAGQELRLTFAPSPTKPFQPEPLFVSLFTEGLGHILTVARDESGSYIASENQIAGAMLERLKDSQSRRATLYSSFYQAALSQGMPADMIEAMLKTFAYDTDFKRRVGPGDGFDAFFDFQDDDSGGVGKPSQLLSIALTVGGETRRFYQYRMPDGTVDFFDAKGNNAKKFLNRKPLRGDARFTSGFGMRLHPLLKQRKMHTGVDWSAPTGTPILASGNGTVEEARRKGGNGNYVRIRHANGYQTAYSHMSKFAAGLKEGVKVNQGQIIGYVGSTGLSSGPHLHLEVLVNNSFVDPLTIHVPRETQLTGRVLADFQKERERIEGLMGRSPVALASQQTSN